MERTLTHRLTAWANKKTSDAAWHFFHQHFDGLRG
jgi:hypothetical protein